MILTIVYLRAESGLKSTSVSITLNDKAFAGWQMLIKIKLDERVNRLDKHFNRKCTELF